MRVLLTNNHLAQMGGTETWVLTMARHLAKKHDVGVYTKRKGFVSDLLADYIDDDPKGYDIALVNHNTTSGVDAKYKIFTSHGMHPLEEPPTNCDEYVAVCEDVAEHYGIDKIIKNPIDTDRFKPIKDISEEPKNILSLTHASVPIANKTASRLKDNVAELINEVDVVVSLGRGALEAMSCGRAVITWDNRPLVHGGGGYVKNPNFTGRVAGIYDKKELSWEEELAKYDKRDGAINREYILNNHRVEDVVRQYGLPN